MNKGVEKGRDLDDAEVLQVVSSLVKQRRDSIEQFSKAGRTDLVDKETAEIAVLEDVPAARRVGRGHRRRGRRSDRRDRRGLRKDMGKVMKAVMPKLRGQECRRPRRQRGGPPQAWRLALPPSNDRSRAPPRRPAPPR